VIPCLPSRNPVERRGSRTIEQSTRNDDLATSGLIEIGSLRRRLAAARGADRAASALLSERLSDAKRLAAAVARGSQPASIEEPAVQPAPEPEGESLKLWIDVPQIAGDRLSQSIRGSFLIEGWAIARDGVASIEISIDGKHFGDAKYGLRREDVGEGHPGWENAAFSGFAMVVPRTAVAGEHSVRVEVRSRNGHSKAIDFAIKAGDVSEEGSLWLPRRKMPRAEIDVTENVLSGLGHHPLFGILLSVADPDDEASLEATLQSLREQAYDRWRALIVTEGLVKRAQLASRLTSWSPELTGRVSIAAADATGDLADGLADMAGAERPDLVAMVAAGDILGCDALLQMAVSSGLHTAAEFLYADERRISPITGKLEAFLKPQWSPDLLLATNYIGRLWCAKSSLLNRIGARLEEWQRFGEYDLVLRCTEAAQRIHHVPKVLCQRGTLQIDSPAREREALARAMDRRGIDGELGQGCAPGYYTLRRRSNNRGLVSIIMPTGGNVALIGKCLPGLFERTANQNFELIILYNTSTKLEVFPYLEAIASDPRVRIIDSKGSFNFSRICNLGAAASRGEFLLFLNDDIEVIEPDWMDGLIQHAERPEVGAVGARLLYPDRTVQHGGIFWIAGTLGGRHSFRHLPDAEPGYFGLAVTPRNVLAVTGACIMMRRNWFEKIGGFDESHTVINNDVDLCLRCWSHGGLVVYEPAVTLIHHELATRHDMPDEYDTQGFWEKWGPLLKAGDPYYHPNLSRRANDYSADEEPLQRLYAGHPLFRREEIQRILVSKLDHIGDFITAVPALKRLHGLFPEAELYLLAPPATAALAGLVPDIKEVINFEFFHTRSALGERELSEEDLIALQCRLAPLRSGSRSA
jgi:GT2 family glycosyltransferase